MTDPSTDNPWTQWENALTRIRPALAVPYFDSEQSTLETGSSPDVTPGVFAWKQSVIAIHIDAAPLLLPYWQVPSHVSWVSGVHDGDPRPEVCWDVTGIHGSQRGCARVRGRCRVWRRRGQVQFVSLVDAIGAVDRASPLPRAAGRSLRC